MSFEVAGFDQDYARDAADVGLTSGTISEAIDVELKVANSPAAHIAAKLVFETLKRMGLLPEYFNHSHFSSELYMVGQETLQLIKAAKEAEVEKS